MRHSVATIRFTVETPIPSEALLRALTDFTPNRPTLWRNLDPAHYTVHARGETWADVTEGSGIAGGVWERSRYDWSQPGVVTATLLESNSFAPGSSWRYQIEPDGRGGSRVHCTVRRIGKGVKGRLVVALIGLVGTGVLRRDLEHMLGQLNTGTS